MKKGEIFFSFEFFPPKTEAGVINLFHRFDRMGELDPLFIDVTWSAGGSTAGKKNQTLQIVKESQHYCCIPTNMHLTCNTSTKEEIREILKQAKENGIRNILALRGDPPTENIKLSEDFKHAVDLVKFIRAEFGKYFCISVAGYPYGHPDCPDRAMDIKHLKEKVDAGADFVISQLFFEADDFLKWVEDCRAIGIKCPIIPGILPIQGYQSLRNITKMCSIPVPDYITKAILPIKDNDEAIKEFGIKFAVEMCQKLIKSGTPGLHFYTLNQETATIRILKELDLVKPKFQTRELPWKRAAIDKRCKEDVRPIYWSNRAKSYLSRTEVWDEYPNGRWGDSRSPAFGDLSDYHIFIHQPKYAKKDLKKLWGENPKTPEEIGSIFVSFLEGKIDKLPWIDSGLSSETNLIRQELIKINRAGFWTINSQPRVNGAPSTDADVGWGGNDGLVYQKAYLEFFTSPEKFKIFLEVVQKFGNRINYQAANMKEYPYISNLDVAMAVTWGVFPGKQVIQPTITDPESFRVWKEEAFRLWVSKWADIYDNGTDSNKLIHEIHDNYFLVNIVDNNFVNGNIFDVLNEVMKTIQERADSDYNPENDVQAHFSWSYGDNAENHC